MDERLTDRLRALGARFDGERIAHFGDAPKEAHAVRSAAGVAWLGTEHARFTLYGPDATRFLQGQVTNHVARLAPGEGCPAAHLGPNGKILGFSTIVRNAPDRYELVCAAEHAERLHARLAKFVVLDDCTLEAPQPITEILLSGPDVSGILARVGLAPSPELLVTPYRSEANDRIRLTSTPITGEIGVRISGDRPDAAEEILDALLADGAAHPVGCDALEILRIEAGVPRFGVDFGKEQTPAECIPWAVSYDKGCYVGQEVVARMRTYGEPPTRLFGLRSATPIPAGAPLSDSDGAAAGVVTSSAACGSGGASIALTRLRKSHAAADLSLTAQRSGATEAVSVTTCALPICPAPWSPWRT